MLLTKVWLSDVTSKENQGYLIVVPYFLHFFHNAWDLWSVSSYLYHAWTFYWMDEVYSSVRNLLKRFQGLLDVVNQVVNVFNSYRQPYQVGGDACLAQLLVA